jgi:hypothetical protein
MCNFHKLVFMCIAHCALFAQQNCVISNTPLYYINCQCGNPPVNAGRACYKKIVSSTGEFCGVECTSCDDVCNSSPLPTPAIGSNGYGSFSAFGMPVVGGSGNNCKGFTLGWFCIKREGTPIGRPLSNCMEGPPSGAPPLSAYSIRSGHSERDGTHLCLAYDSHDGRLKKAACDQNPNKSLFVGDERSDTCYSYPSANAGSTGGKVPRQSLTPRSWSCKPDASTYLQ